MSYDKNILKKKNKSRTFDTESNLYLFVYTSMLILNFHLREINNWQHLLQQGLFWQNFISPIYMCRYISHCLASPHLAKKNLRALHCLNCCTACHRAFCCPASIHPSIKSRVPLVKPPKGPPYLTMIQCIDPMGSVFPGRDQFVPMYPNFQLTGQTK